MRPLPEWHAATAADQALWACLRPVCSGSHPAGRREVTRPRDFARFDAHVRPQLDPSPPRARRRHRRPHGPHPRLAGWWLRAGRAPRPLAGTTAREAPGPIHAGNTFGWYGHGGLVYDETFVGPLSQALARRGPGRGPQPARHAHPQHRQQGHRLAPDDDPRPRVRPLGDPAPAAPVRPQEHAVPRAHRAGPGHQRGRGLRRAEHRAQQVHDGRQRGQLLHPDPPGQPVPGVDAARLRPGPVAHLRRRGHPEADLVVRRLPRHPHRAPPRRAVRPQVPGPVHHAGGQGQADEQGPHADGLAALLDPAGHERAVHQGAGDQADDVHAGLRRPERSD